MFTNEIERCPGQRVAETLNGAEAGGRLDPSDISAGGADDDLHRRRYFGADAVAGDHHDGSRHREYLQSTQRFAVSVCRAAPPSRKRRRYIRLNSKIPSAI